MGGCFLFFCLPSILPLVSASFTSPLPSLGETAQHDFTIVHWAKQTEQSLSIGMMKNCYTVENSSFIFNYGNLKFSRFSGKAKAILQ